MEGIDIKKLIASFLGVAIIASILILILPSIYSGFTGLIASTSKSGLVFTNETSSQSASPSAFLPKTKTLTDYYNSTVSDFNADDSTNLTRVAAQQLAEGLIKQNPNGPIMSANNQASIISPDSNQIVSNIQNYIQAHQSLVIPEPPYQYQVIANPTAQQNTNYINSVIGIFNDTVANGKLNISFQTASSPEDFAVLSTVYDQAIQKLAVLEVPSPLLSYQKSLIKTLYDQKYIDDDLAGYQTDPLKSAIVAQAGVNGLIQQLFTNDQKNLADNLSQIKFEYVKTVSENTTGQNKNLFDFISEIIINKAYAQQVLGTGANTVHVLTSVPESAFQALEIPQSTLTASNTTAANVWSKVIVPMMQHLLTVFIQQLVHQIIAETVDWINNGYQGQPFYVTNWNTALTQYSNNAAGAAISAIVPGLCTPFSFSVQIALLPTYVQQQTYCTLSDMGANITNFANDFTQGGWVEYINSLSPQNNGYGATLLAKDIVTKAASDADQQKQQELIANSGYLSQSVCDQAAVGQQGSDWATTTLTEAQQINAETGMQYQNIGNGEATVYASSTSANADKISPSSPQCLHTRVVTPGTMAQSELTSAAGAWVGSLVNAKDIDALTNALVNSLITNVVKAAEKGLAGASVNSYKSPAPLFQANNFMPQNMPPTPHDTATLNKDLTQVANWMTANNILLYSVLPNVKPLVQLFQTNLQTDLQDLSMFVYDTTPATCADNLQKLFNGPMQSFGYATSSEAAVASSTRIAVNNLTAADHALLFLQSYDAAYSANEPILGLITSTNTPSGISMLLTNDANLVAGSADIVSFVDNASTTIGDLETIPSLASTTLNSLNIQTGGDPSGIVSAITDDSNQVIGQLSTAYNNFESSAQATQLVDNASSSFNNYLSDIAPLQNSINIISGEVSNSSPKDTYDQLAGIIPVSGGVVSASDISTTTVIGLENNIIADLTMLKASSLSLATSTAQQNLTQLVSGAISDFQLSQNNFISNINSTISLLGNSPSDQDYSSADSSMLNSIQSELQTDNASLNNLLSNLSNVVQNSNFEFLSQVGTLSQSLSDFYNDMTFNGLEKIIYKSMSDKYGNTNDQLTQYAGLQCSLRSNTNKSMASHKDSALGQLEQFTQNMKGANRNLGAGLDFVPFICNTITNSASPVLLSGAPACSYLPKSDQEQCIVQSSDSSGKNSTLTIYYTIKKIDVWGCDHTGFACQRNHMYDLLISTSSDISSAPYFNLLVDPTITNLNAGHDASAGSVSMSGVSLPSSGDNGNMTAFSFITDPKQIWADGNVDNILSSSIANFLLIFYHANSSTNSNLSFDPYTIISALPKRITQSKSLATLFANYATGGLLTGDVLKPNIGDYSPSQYYQETISLTEKLTNIVSDLSGSTSANQNGIPNITCQ